MTHDEAIQEYPTAKSELNSGISIKSVHYESCSHVAALLEGSAHRSGGLISLCSSLNTSSSPLHLLIVNQ